MSPRARDARSPTGRGALADAVERSAAPDAVRAALERMVEAAPGLAGRLANATSLTPAGSALVSVLGASNALGRLLLTDPAGLEVLAALERPAPWDGSGIEALVRSKQLGLLRIAARDLLGVDDLETVGSALAALAARVLDDALGLAGGTAPVAVVGMGKLGGQELNYASDVDVLFVSAGGETDRAGLDRVRRALEIARGCFRVDVDLRPEGRAGALARPVESYRSYWQRWADAWEFQALLKARPVAGDIALGETFARAADQALWGRTLSADELSELRAMKARAEAMVARKGLAGRELKRGPGGIRDVEFAVQLLQLVHGRADPAIRLRSTLGALRELGSAGYVSTDDAAALADHYRFLRTVEHRLQLVEEEQTHAVPEGGPARTRLARVLGFEDGPEATAAERFDDELRERQVAVRAIHERLFFRPLLEAFAGAPAVMDAAVVDRRLEAFGFADARRTRAAVDDLALGLTRTSRLMAQLLPLLLDWLSLSPDPDLGLLGLRNLVLHPHHRSVLVNSFRESPEAARRLVLLLGTSRALAEALERNPELMAAIDDDRALEPGSRDELVVEANRRLQRAGDDVTRRAQLLRLRQDQFVRTAARDVLDLDDVDATGRSLAVTAEALLEAAVEIVRNRVAEEHGHAPSWCVVGMGRLGGAELAYASDLDVLFVHGEEPPPAPDAVGSGTLMAEALLQLLHGSSPASRVVQLDLGLRPEGSQGRLARDLDGYRLYFSRWAETWERQALVRARVVAGDAELGSRFMALASEFVWGRPITDDEVAYIRRMKARIERERIATRDDPQFHLKLGKGSLSDVEWTVQLLQLRNGVQDPSTLGALAALEDAGAVVPDDARALRESYAFCERTRNRWHLVGALAGGARSGDALPAQAHQLSKLARSLRTTPAALREDYRRVTRRARRVTERLFYGIED